MVFRTRGEVSFQDTFQHGHKGVHDTGPVIMEIDYDDGGLEELQAEVFTWVRDSRLIQGFYPPFIGLYRQYTMKRG